jgi:4-hydroxyacetophenone monooxygenase
MLAIPVERAVEIDADRLRTSVDAANLPALLMSLFQLTGDRKWLEEPYRPTRTKGLSFHDSAGLPADRQAEIREAAVAAILAWAGGMPAAVPAPSGDLLVEMMSTCMGEDVPPEYGPMMAEEMGFTTVEDGAALRGRLSPADFSVVVVGAGVSGLLAALKLREAGVHCTVLEKSNDVGGTWLNNRYPGCGVDTPSYLYSFSFFPRDWSTHFGKAQEVRAYIREMVTAFDLLSAIKFGHEVTEAAYDETSSIWSVTARTEDGETHSFTANAVITAVGQLNVPKVPTIPGIDEFSGPAFHSACWPDDLDVTGKRVAVVGTGASAMQIVPAVAGEVAQLTVFQRSPQWVAPSSDYFSRVGDEIHWLMNNVPNYRQWYRFRLAWQFNDKVHGALQVDPDWPHPDRSVSAVNDGHRAFFTGYIEQQLEGRDDLIEKSLPRYPPFGKRMLIDNGWFAALKEPNVELVVDEIEAVTPTGIRTAGGEEYDVDLIVFATGFEARRLLHPLNIRGRSGQSIREVWGDDDARAYLGITTPDFPNLFFMYGPNTNLGHGGSYIFIAECQIRYIVDLIEKMLREDVDAVDCLPEVHDDYNEKVDDAHAKMIWTHPGMDTWYRNAAGRVVTNAPWRVVDYWKMTHEANLDDFAGVASTR